MGYLVIGGGFLCSHLCPPLLTPPPTLLFTHVCGSPSLHPTLLALLDSNDGKIRNAASTTLTLLVRDAPPLFSSLLASIKPKQKELVEASLTAPRSSKLQLDWPAVDFTTVLAAQDELQKQTLTLEYTSREPTDLIAALAANKVFASSLASPKWSEKSAALQLIPELAGPAPYKLVSSSPSSYQPLLADLKKNLAHTHPTVATHAMRAFTVLFEGVGPPLFPHAKPLTKLLLEKTRDKKLLSPALACLLTLYGNCLSQSDVLEEVSLNASTSNNPIQKLAGWTWLTSTLAPPTSSLPKASKTPPPHLPAALVSALTSEMDNAIKQQLTKALSLLPPDAFAAAIAPLESSHPKIYAALTKPPAAKSDPATTAAPAAALKPAPAPSPAHTPASAPPPPPSLDDSDPLATLAAMSIPDFDLDVDSGGIAAALPVATPWAKRSPALLALAAFVSSLAAPPTPTQTSAFLFIAKSSSKSFKDSNFNIIKATHAILTALLSHATTSSPPVSLLTSTTIAVSTSKLSDKKLAPSSAALLTSLLSSTPSKHMSPALDEIFAAMSKIPSPLSHENLLAALLAYSQSSGARSFSGAGLKALSAYLFTAAAHSNPNVKSAALALAGNIHSQIGISFKATLLALPAAKSSPAAATALSDAIAKHPHDPASAPAPVDGGGDDDDSDALALPRADLFASLPKDILTSLALTEGKNSWKTRMAALDTIADELKKSSYLVTATPAVQDLLRALKVRLADSQSNLKPKSANLISSILSSLSPSDSAKYLKLVSSSLISIALTDNKKPMRDAAFQAISLVTKMPESSGLSGANKAAIENLLPALTHCLKNGDAKGAGTPALLNFLTSLSPELSKFDAATANAKECLIEKELAMVLLKCLTSKTADCRSSADKLLGALSASGVVTRDSVSRSLGKLLPAQQRDVGDIVARLSTSGATARKASVAAPAAPPARKSSLAATAGAPRPTPVSTPPRKKSVVASKPAAAAPVAVAAASTSSHPFFGGTSSSTKEHRASSAFRKKENWPDFPEQPTHALAFSMLKKNFAPLLSTSALPQFFPAAGMKKQDDALLGCQLLCSAIEYERNNDLANSPILDLLDMLLKWLACAFVAKDNTSGLEQLLTSTTMLCDFLLSLNYELTDVEARAFLPILVEKAGANNKARFSPGFDAALQKSKSMYNCKSLAGVLLTVVDFSKNQKARGATMESLVACVSEGGMQAIGKKGLRSVLEGLDDNVTDVRNSSLNVIEVILGKLNGDKIKLFKLAGSGLSSRGQSLIVERMKHGGEKAVAEEEDRHVRTPKKRIEGKTDKTPLSDGVVARELDLKIGEQSMVTSPLKNEECGDVGEANPFHFSDSGVNSRAVLTPRRRKSLSPKVVAEPVVEVGKVVRDKDEPARASTGTAASLRARLAAIRGKRSSSSASSMSATQAAIEAATASVGVTVGGRELEVEEEVKAEVEAEVGAVVEPQVVAQVAVEPVAPIEPEQEAESPEPSANEPMAPYSYEELHGQVEALLNSPATVSEDEQVFINGREALKILHSALTSQSQSDRCKPVYETVLGDASRACSLLTTVFSFCFKTQEVCVPILSVTLACLMAIFRGSLSKMIDQQAFQALASECCRGLLAPQLSSSTGVSDGYANTQQQLIRAINKLAIQCAVSAGRNTSLQGLISVYMLFQRSKQTKLSKVAAKLLARVTKAETASNGESAFGVGDGADAVANKCDIEILLCCLEDFFVEVDRSFDDNDRKEEARRLGKGLVSAIVGDAGKSRLDAISSVMLQNLEFDVDTLSYGMFLECVKDKEEGEEGSSLMPAFTPVKERKVSEKVEGETFSTPEEKERTDESFSTPAAMLKQVVETPNSSAKQRDEFSQLVVNVGGADSTANKQLALRQLNGYCVGEGLSSEATEALLSAMTLSGPFKQFIVGGLRELGKGEGESKENVVQAPPVNARLMYLKEKLAKKEIGGSSGAEISSSSSSCIISSGAVEKKEVSKEGGGGAAALRERLKKVQQLKARKAQGA